MINDIEMLKKIMMNVEHIGTPHKIILKLLEKSDMDVDVDEIAFDIAQDATVSALILKTANSVHFARGKEVKTIKEAVIHLGIGYIKKIFFAIDMIGIFRGHLASDRFNEIDFWKHSLAGAILASKYAAFKKSCNPETAYMAALLRNIGVLAIRQFTPGEFDQMLLLQSTECFSFTTLSKIVLGICHREIAYMIGQKWNLPSSIPLSIRETINFEDINHEINAIREAILFSDDLLHVTRYSVWDVNYMPGNFDFHGIPCEEMFNDTSVVVESMMEKFWG